MRHLSRPLRTVMVILFVAFASIYAMRSAFVSAYAEDDVALAAAVWRDHPAVIAAASLVAVGEAAGAGKGVQPETWAELRRLSEVAPLAPEPFLVRAATELRASRFAQAERLLLLARRRAPRSLSARLLLSDVYLKEGRLAPALREIAVLRRLMPALSAAIAPALAASVRSSGPKPQIREVLRDDPELEDLLLSALASDYQNTDLILSLAHPTGAEMKVRPWQQKLVSALVEAQQYERAFHLSHAFSGLQGVRSSLPRFQEVSFDSPFNWRYAQGSAGAATPVNGELHVFFSGQDSINLAQTLLVLPPDNYVLTVRINGNPPSTQSMSWAVRCLPSNRSAAHLPVNRQGTSAVQFNVTADCKAQNLELKGAVQDFPTAAEFDIVSMSLVRAPLR